MQRRIVLTREYWCVALFRAVCGGTLWRVGDVYISDAKEDQGDKAYMYD